MKVNIKIKKLRSEALLPKYAHEGDAGMDLFSLEDYVLKPAERKLFSLGISIELPEGFVALIWDKSGLALKEGIKILGGVIEHTYRGEYGVIVLNTSNKLVEIKKGQKIAQMLIQPVCKAEVEETDTLTETKRGTGGFGSTGK